MRIVALLAVCASPLLSPSQDSSQKSLLIRGAKIYTVSGPVLEPGMILIENGRVTSVGKKVEARPDVETWDASGKVIIPGLVDAGSMLHILDGESGATGSAEQDVLDGLDYFAQEAGEEASASGVTTIHVAPPNRGAINGLSAVLRVGGERETARRVLKRNAALKLTLGASRGETSSAAQRYRDYALLRAAFEGARRYQEAWEKYRKDLEEYEKKKKARDEQKKVEPKKEEPAKDENGKKDEGKEDKKENPPPAPHVPSIPARQSRNRTFPALPGAALEVHSPQDPPAPSRPRPGGQEQPPRRPRKPKFDPRNEVLIRALDGKEPLPVHIEAHQADAIEWALRLAEEFQLKLVLVQATEAYRVAEKIAQSKIPVVAGPILRYGMPKVDYLNHSVECASVLAGAGVDVSIGSFPVEEAGHQGAGAGRFLMEAAALAVSKGMARDAALKAVTLAPARMLGLSDQIGDIAPGHSADLVILSGEPFDAGTRVEKTLVEGRVTWSSPPAESESERPQPPPPAAPAAEPVAEGSILLKGGRIVPMTAPDVADGYVLISGGRIHSLGPAAAPPSGGARVIELPPGSWVLPGFIDAHSHLASVFEVEESTESVTPHVKAVDAFESTHPDARAAISSGVTLAAIAPGNGNLVGGAVALIRLNGERLDRMIWKDAHGLKLSLGRESLRSDGEPTSKAGALDMLRRLLRDPKDRVRRSLLDRKEPALIHARLAEDIVRAAELYKTFNLKAVLVHGDEAALALEAIRDAKLGVAFGPLTASDRAEKLETPGRLVRAGVPVAFVSDAPAAGPSYLRIMAAMAARFGMPPREALRSLTVTPASLLGLEGSFGCLAPGAQGDVVVFSGDPLSLASDVEMVIIGGKVVYRKRMAAIGEER
ncbi:MAG: amidohydrolase family protein [Planctomycetes bacterium]|nr:amidohydrolase family protein [Planctomycetota bacterium]